jgi:hypothetical protein
VASLVNGRSRSPSWRIRPTRLGRDSAKLRDYRICVSVSAIAADIAYAMLTLDAVEAGELSTDDMRPVPVIPMGLRLQVRGVRDRAIRCGVPFHR